MSSPEESREIREAHDELGLVAAIEQSESGASIASTTLKTDDRVLARVTDGIYRQPGSSLRELISNAYDADASQVVVKTDAPRFERIVVEDDGRGMTPVALANLLLHIGGSAKRNDLGRELGITAKDDAFRSPGGRILIGKIGIGLFSVSQLTHSFQIITTVANDSYRTVATVVLRQYSDDQLPDAEGNFESGKVNIWRERAADVESHGTTIVLTRIRPQAQDTLRSRNIWSAIEQAEASAGGDEDQSIEPPRFHIGRVDASGELIPPHRGQQTRLPWDVGDAPADSFRKMVSAVWSEVDQANPNPQLERIFDYYLQMIWQLSLAAPLPYVEGHLFDMDPAGWANAYELSNEPKGAASKLRGVGTIRERLGLRDPIQPVSTFRVLIDELDLFRPIKFRHLPATAHALKQPIAFLGKCREDFAGIPKEFSAGTLEFEAYLFWTPKVAPTEHQGSLIRIHGSSGTLFDPTFMRYQVSEQTRLRQITCEIFVHEGLDGALNIDRESFNHAHPHAVYITKWLHSALRQLATTQKRLASEARDAARNANREAVLSEIQQVAERVWREQSDDPAATPPGVELVDPTFPPTTFPDSYAFRRDAILSPAPRLAGVRLRRRQAAVEEKLKSIAQVLASFGLLDSLSRPRQEELLKAIYQILRASDE
jgi:hypothetical protein